MSTIPVIITTEDVRHRHLHLMHIFIRLVLLWELNCYRKRCLSFSARICISVEVRHFLEILIFTILNSVTTLQAYSVPHTMEG